MNEQEKAAPKPQESGSVEADVRAQPLTFEDVVKSLVKDRPS